MKEDTKKKPQMDVVQSPRIEAATGAATSLDLETAVLRAWAKVDAAKNEIYESGTGAVSMSIDCMDGGQTKTVQVSIRVLSSQQVKEQQQNAKDEFHRTGRHLFSNRENGDNEIHALYDLGLACMRLVEDGVVGKGVNLAQAITLVRNQVRECCFIYEKGKNDKIIQDKISMFQDIVKSIQNMDIIIKRMFRSMFFEYIASADFGTYTKDYKDNMVSIMEDICSFIEATQPTKGESSKRTINLMDIMNCWGVTNRI